MQDATIPTNKAHRLRSLHRYHILVTVQEAVFDEQVDLAATICEAPIALKINLIERGQAPVYLLHLPPLPAENCLKTPQNHTEK